MTVMLRSLSLPSLYRPIPLHLLHGLGIQLLRDESLFPLHTSVCRFQGSKFLLIELRYGQTPRKFSHLWLELLNIGVVKC